MYSASAFAANTIVRSAVAASFPLFTTQMFEAVRALSLSSSFQVLLELLLIFSNPVVGYKLGMYADRLRRPFVLAESVFVLQIRS
jgi:hypothetical protein